MGVGGNSTQILIGGKMIPQKNRKRINQNSVSTGADNPHFKLNIVRKKTVSNLADVYVTQTEKKLKMQQKLADFIEADVFSRSFPVHIAICVSGR